MHFLRTIAIAAGTLAAVAAFAVSASGAAGGGSIVKLGPSNLGRVLVDSHGKTLYLWAHDKAHKSTCNGDCAEYWPPLLTSGRPVAAAGVKAALLGTTRRSDGRIQITYAGHPLYTYVADTGPGQTFYVNFFQFGGNWPALNAAGHEVK